jgi:hypothetical protein
MICATSMTPPRRVTVQGARYPEAAANDGFLNNTLLIGRAWSHTGQIPVIDRKTERDDIPFEHAATTAIRINERQ